MPACPLAHLQTRRLWQVARSADLNVSSTQIAVDMGSSQRVRAVAMCGHNLSRSAVWRIRAGSVPGADDAYSGAWEAVWTLSFESDLDWEDAAWWSGDVDPFAYLGHPYPAILTLPGTAMARYVSIEIDDGDNPAGYVQIGRVFVGGGFSPTWGREYGLTDGWVDDSDVMRSESGTLLGVERRRRRVAKFVLPRLTHDDAAIWHELQRRQGRLGEVLYVPNVTNMQETQRYGMLGTLSELSAIEWPYPMVRGAAVQIEEV